MNLESIPLIIQWLGGLLAYTALGIVLYGIWTTVYFACFAPLMTRSFGRVFFV